MTEYDDTEFGSVDRFKIVLHARIHVLMKNRSAQGKTTCNAGSAKAFLIAVANHDRGHELGCVARQDTLERESGLSADTQARVAKILEDAGALTFTVRSNQKGSKKKPKRGESGSSNQYHLNYEALHAWALLEQLNSGKQESPDDHGPAEARTVRKLRTVPQPEKTVRNLRDVLKNGPQSTDRTVLKLRSERPAVCGPKNKQTTTQQISRTAVGARASLWAVCVSEKLMDEDAKRRQIVDAAQRVRRQQAAMKLLREAGVWEKSIPDVIEVAMKHGAGNPLPRIHDVLEGYKRTVDAKRRRNQDVPHPGKWITAALLEGWDVSQGRRKRSA